MKISTLMTAVLVTVGVASTASAQTLKKIADSGRMSVAYREASVPFSYVIGTTKAVGFSVDITEAIIDDVRKAVKKPKLEVTYTPVTSQNRIPLLQNGTIDLECGSTTNNSVRGKDVQFAINYFYTGTRLLTKVNSGVKDWADLSKKTISTTSGTTNAKVVRTLGNERSIDMQVLMGKDHDDSLLLVESDRAVAFAMDDILLFGLRANSKNPASLQVVGESIQVEPYACMMRKDDPEFKALVDGAITKLIKSGEFSKLYTKWFESPTVPKGINLNLPMSQQLKDNLKALSDKPAI